MENFETVFLACAWVLVIVMMVSFIAVFIILIRVAFQLIFETKKPAPEVKEKKPVGFVYGGVCIMEGDILERKFSTRDTSAAQIRLSNKDNSAKSLSVITGISASRCDAVITKYLNDKAKETISKTK